MRQALVLIPGEHQSGPNVSWMFLDEKCEHELFPSLIPPPPCEVSLLTLGNSLHFSKLTKSFGSSLSYNLSYNLLFSKIYEDIFREP